MGSASGSGDWPVTTTIGVAGHVIRITRRISSGSPALSPRFKSRRIRSICWSPVARTASSEVGRDDNVPAVFDTDVLQEHTDDGVVIDDEDARSLIHRRRRLLRAL
jgi:hypothetical protein